MLIPELINRAVSGHLRFDFIESTVTIAEASSLTSLKGRAYAEAANEFFYFHFMPRAPFSSEQHARLLPGDGRRFEIAGTERGSAVWTGTAAALRVVEGMRGPAVHAHVPEWTREDARSVRASFSRVVVAGQHHYPTIAEHFSGSDARTASVNCAGIRIDFRNHGHYTEICTTSALRAPGHLADAIVTTLGDLLGVAMRWTYREQHIDGRRRISVRPCKPIRDTDSVGRSDKLEHDQFWRQYAVRLAELL